ncbi:MAG: ABC transporter permease [Treponema sp.]|jgi:simple sugar transport system permease protein|nr:ABC transporter permease [Treponema sp.]
MTGFGSFAEGLFTSATPLILASLGALLTELAGVLGIFIEGFMNAGAFFSWVIAGWTGSVVLGTAASASAAAAAGFCLARFVRKTGANPFVAGLAVNIAAGGVTDYLSVLWFGTKGVLRNPAVAARLDAACFDTVLPWMRGRLPWIWLSLAAFVVLTLLVNHSSWGLRLRASGLAPEAAKERGIRPGRYWEASWAAAAALAVLAGAALCFRIGAYTPGSAAGRGWISLAAVYLGFRRPLGVFAAALVFALAERGALVLQGSRFLPATLLLGLPNALALILYASSCMVRKKKFR